MDTKFSSDWLRGEHGYLDAEVAKRKEPMSYEEVRNIISAGRGQHLDPDIVFSIFCDLDNRYTDHIRH